LNYYKIATVGFEGTTLIYFSCRAHGAVIRVYDAAGNVIETHEQKGDFREW
jgi:hypothetical protein